MAQQERKFAQSASGDLKRLYVQGITKRLWPGLVNFVAALAYHFCLNLLVAFTKPDQSTLVVPCRERRKEEGRGKGRKGLLCIQPYFLQSSTGGYSQVSI